jgi:hypothetical protein
MKIIKYKETMTMKKIIAMSLFATLLFSIVSNHSAPGKITPPIVDDYIDLIDSDDENISRLEKDLMQLTAVNSALFNDVKKTLTRVDTALIDSIEASNREINAIEQGGKYAYKLFFKQTTEGIPTNTREEYLRSILDLQSFFYSLCFQIRPDGLGFEEGTFFIEDPSGIFKEFLQGYLEKVRSEGCDLGNPDSKHVFASNPFAYYRVNSHGFTQAFGIDNRFSEKNYPNYWMNKFGHILIGFTDTGVWLKPEKSGCSYGEVGSHALHLVEAQVSKKSKYFFDMCEYYTGYKLKEIEGDDSPLYNKERTPTNIIKKFIKLFPEAPKDQSKGIGLMLTYAQSQLQANDFTDNISKKVVEQFIYNLKNEYTHTTKPQGQEIYLTNEDLILAQGYTPDANEAENNFIIHIFAPLKRLINQYKATKKIDKKIAIAPIRESIESFIKYAPVMQKFAEVDTIKKYLSQTTLILQRLEKMDDKELIQEIENNQILETEYQNAILKR